jgi:hypothetical protein
VDEVPAKSRPRSDVKDNRALERLHDMERSLNVGVLAKCPATLVKAVVTLRNTKPVAALL